MKIYKFFRIPDEDDRDNNFAPEQKYTLYAITNKKKYAERFKEDRNMDKFIFKIDRDVAPEEYAELCNDFNNRNAVLELYPLTTIFDNNHTRQNSVQKKVLMTHWEKQLIVDQSTVFEDERFWHMMPFPLIFDPKFSKALDVLQFTTFYKLMTADYLPHFMAMKLASEDEDYSAPSLEFDEVQLFIDRVKNTL